MSTKSATRKPAKKAVARKAVSRKSVTRKPVITRSVPVPVKDPAIQAYLKEHTVDPKRVQTRGPSEVIIWNPGAPWPATRRRR